MDIIRKNAEVENDSFLYELNYRKFFNKQKFEILIQGIVDLIKLYSSCSNSYEKFILLENNFPNLFHVYDRVLILFVSHYDKNDLFKISNFEYIDNYDLIERFRFVVRCVFSGENYSSILDYEDELGKLVEG